jgi:hypothetical protein
MGKLRKVSNEIRPLITLADRQILEPMENGRLTLVSVEEKIRTSTENKKQETRV